MYLWQYIKVDSHHNYAYRPYSKVSTCPCSIIHDPPVHYRQSRYHSSLHNGQHRAHSIPDLCVPYCRRLSSHSRPQGIRQKLAHVRSNFRDSVESYSCQLNSILPPKCILHPLPGLSRYLVFRLFSRFSKKAGNKLIIIVTGIIRFTSRLQLHRIRSDNHDVRTA